ncbi:hypothetical protein BaRGS_00002902 [Batillaria attramentaria]|uniref:Uncharacterized protein n=1 Tax=Batillaria attramentaria TaxID=370345 RepID=A0ABD0M1K3_9CAEN
MNIHDHGLDDPVSPAARAPPAQGEDWKRRTSCIVAFQDTYKLSFPDLDQTISLKEHPATRHPPITAVQKISWFSFWHQPVGHSLACRESRSFRGSVMVSCAIRRTCVAVHPRFLRAMHEGSRTIERKRQPCCVDLDGERVHTDHYQLPLESCESTSAFGEGWRCFLLLACC